MILREGKILKPYGFRNRNSVGDMNIRFLTYARELVFNILRENKISSRDEVLLPRYLCNSVIDYIKPLTMNIKFYKINREMKYNKDELVGHITDRTKLIMFVDYFGVETDVDNEIRQIAENNHIILLKDAAHSFLSLIHNNFKNIGMFDYTICSIYKTLPLFVGSCVFGDVNFRSFISLQLFLARLARTAAKYMICPLSMGTLINRKKENLIVTDNSVDPIGRYHGENMLRAYKWLLNRLDVQGIINQRKMVASIFFEEFDCLGRITNVFDMKTINNSVLMNYPIWLDTVEERNSLFSFLRKKCIDAYPWPTFDKMNCGSELWENILLLPLDLRVLHIIKQFHGSN